MSLSNLAKSLINPVPWNGVRLASLHFPEPTSHMATSSPVPDAVRNALSGRAMSTQARQSAKKL